MSIIAVLLTIAVPRYFHTLERSRETVLRQDLSVLREAIDKHFGDYGQYPDSLAALVERHYIRAVPVDPFTQLGRGLADGGVRGRRPSGHPRRAQRRRRQGSDGLPYKEW